MAYPTDSEIAQATPEEAAALVHTHIFAHERKGSRWYDKEGRITKAPQYLTSPAAQFELLDRFGLVVGKAREGDELFKSERQWFSGRLGEFFIASATPGAAVCKATLIAGAPKQHTGEQAKQEEEEPDATQE